MKKILLSLCGFTLLLGSAFTANAQNGKSNENNEEIIIRKKGGKDKKLTVEMNGNDILINGKPLSEFHEDGVTVKTYRNKSGNSSFEGNNFLFTPGAGGKNFNFWNDSSFGGGKTFLGITTEKVADGVKITEVVEGSAAGKAGLKEGDLITTIGDKKINEPGDVVTAIHSYKPKDEVKIQYQRNGKAGETKATLSESKGFMKTFTFNNDGSGEYFHDSQPFISSIPRSPNGSFKMLFTGNHKLGVRIEDIDEGDGVKITNVEESSAAEKAGLKKDDIIIEVDGKKVKDVNDVRSKLMDVKEKSSYTVKATRNGSAMTFDIKIPKRKNNADL